jgi:hypothetical protein
MNLGEKITISEFAYTNKHGGTGISKPFSKRFEGVEYFEEHIEVIVIKNWSDYETGVRGWALPNQKNKRLIKFLQRNCKEGEPVPGDLYGWVDQPGEFVIFWSEHDII